MEIAGPIERLAAFRERFLAFVRRRISDPDLAEEIVQSSLLKATENIGSLQREESLVPWFYAILRNTINDAYRRQNAERALPLPEDFDLEADEEAELVLCECFRDILPSLKDEYATLIDMLDLRRQPATEAAAALGITTNNLKVRHHRARQALRRRLEETCRVCAEHHCLDCTCETATAVRARV